jgi:hypothetical protein
MKETQQKHPPMPTTTIRVSIHTHERLRQLAASQNRSLGQIVTMLIDDHEKREFFVGLGEDFDRLRSDPGFSTSYEEEVAAWDATLVDGLNDEWLE